MNDPEHFAHALCLLDKGLNRFARRHIDKRLAYFEPGITQNSCRCVGIFLAKVSEQNQFARADPPRNRLAN
jgi:hypothetical protein